MNFEHILPQIEETKIIAVLVIEDASVAVNVAGCLMHNGIKAMELTLRTPAAFEALATIKSNVPQMLAGVGTVLTVEQVQKCAELKADFGVSPGLNPTGHL